MGNQARRVFQSTLTRQSTSLTIRARQFSLAKAKLWAGVGLPLSAFFIISSGFASEPRAPAGPPPTVKSVAVPCDDMSKLLGEASDLRNSWKLDNLKRAIDLYEKALSCSAHSAAETEILRSIGEIHDILGDHERARTSYLQALTASKTNNDRRTEANTLVDLGSSYAYSSDTKRSINYSTEALTIGRQLGDKHIQGRALTAIGHAYYVGGDAAAARRNLVEALRNLQTPDDRNERAETLLRLGYTYGDSGELKEALASHQESLTIGKELGNLQAEARALTAIGGLYSLWGERQKALDYHRQSLDLLKAIGDLEGQAVALNWIGYGYQQVGEYQKALSAFSEALGLFRATANREGQTYSVQYVGNIQMRLGKKQEAEDCYLTGLNIGQSVKDNLAVAYARNNLGVLYQSTGQTQKAIDSYQQALLIYRREKNLRSCAYALNNIGYALTSSGQPKESLAYHSEALNLIRAVGDKQQESLILYDIARADSNLGNRREARENLEKAIEIAESVRAKVASLDFRASYFATVRPQYELYIDTLMQLAKEHNDGELVTKTFEISERSRARSLLESLGEDRANIRQDANPALLERAQQLQQTLNADAARRLQLIAVGNNVEADTVSKEIDRVTSEYQDLNAQIRVTSPRYATLTQPLSLKLEEIQRRVLDDDTVLLEYSLGEQRSYVWAITQTQILSYELPGRAEIENMARALYSSLTANQSQKGDSVEQAQARIKKADDDLPGQIAQLSELVLKPVAGQLTHKRVLVVADGALQYVPFQILGVTPSVTSAAAPVPLVINHEVINEPSASALAFVMNESTVPRASSKSVAILADPVFSLDDPRLPSAVQNHSKSKVVLNSNNTTGDAIPGDSQISRLLSSSEEAEVIMSLVPTGTGLKATGFAANRNVITNENLNQYQIIHFATHALLDAEHPELSGIVLSLVDEKGQPQDGFLRLHDIYNLKLPVNLVVLSACQTGLGKDVKGEGLIGLTRGFMYAGASGVVASLWKVDDEATAELMKHFYEGLFEKGLTPASALREAQLALRQQKRWQEPYYWAGFVIQGQYNQKVALGYKNRLWEFGVLVMVGGVLLASIFLMIRRRSRRVRATQAD